MTLFTAIGLMSGTSLDGVDVALLETDGEAVVRTGPVGYRVYADVELEMLRAALTEAASLSDRQARPGAIAEAERLVTRAHAEAVEEFLFRNRIKSREIDIIGFPGQTVVHKPRQRLTVQIGDGQALAKRIGIVVAHDFRAADVEAGGEGAPLVPVFHRALVRTLALPRPVAVVNIGGISNITFIGSDADPIAFDTGPGNAPIDDLVFARIGARLDRNGTLAAGGKVDERTVANVLSDVFFEKNPPKSLDRAKFARLPLGHLSTADAAATATAIVAAAIVKAVPHLPRHPATWILSGGGARNPVLVSMLRERLGLPVRTAEEVGWSSDALEAQAFAYLAVRTLKGLPISFPTTTGVAYPMTGGVLSQP